MSAAIETLPATFPSEDRARAWSTGIRRDLYDVVGVVPSKTKPGRFQLQVRRLAGGKAAANA